MAEAIVDHSKAHNGRTDDALRQIEELQALADKQDKWATVTNIRLDTLEAYVHQPVKPAEPPRRVIQPKTFSEFKQIVENGVDE